MRRRRWPRAAGPLLGVVALLTAFDLLRGEPLTAALLSAVAVALVMVVYATVMRRLGRREAVHHRDVDGYVAAWVRTPDGSHSRLTTTWQSAELRRQRGSVRISPLGGPSALPFTVSARSITPDTSPVPLSIRLVTTRPRALLLADDDGLVAVGLEAEHVPWLQDGLADMPHDEDGR
ncbi:hypothetical protein [Cellulomonas marina]|uniref:Uncharacterized protein n=1 Tax=Cellulomonas marina TaxID=988821 RepID=A0A1I0Z232_9CELL|nr:hypothetical protein [Cellulomonas marina]GIG28187.1 hypothetical protein Cma02nite_07870 [Cellulomonas marina]SFB19621.1 hypothetical protein SAMN05421867_109128 [Cellulomonas marina]